MKAKKINKQEFFFDNKNIDQIKIAQKNAFIKALLKNKIPFREFKINSVDEQTLGELFSYFILAYTSVSTKSGAVDTGSQTDDYNRGLYDLCLILVLFDC